LSEPPHNDKYHIQSSEISFIPTSPLQVLPPGEEGEGVSEEMAEAIDKVIELLEVDGDVAKVWTNLDWSA
jgi:transcriptional/translational regulatory protein YebC/TACO1